MEDLPYIFERFHRGRNTAGIPGSGLGMTIARQIIAAHRGQITAERREAGMIFQVRLPLEQPQ